MTQPRTSCSSCEGTLRVIDHFCDYSTTQGPMTSYDLVACNDCQETALRLTGARVASA